MTRVDVFAPAKLNLTLRVGAPRADGRHPLDSLVAFTRTCGDHLSFESHHDLGLTINGPFASGLSDQGDNLVIRAAGLLRAQCNVDHGAKITLTKNLPIASGIGGGSADCAAALIGLNDLWGCGLTGEQVQVLGGQLGADVPACVLGQSLRMTGTGETIEPMAPLPPLGVVLVNPLIACPTGPVYKEYDKLGRFSATHAEPFPDLIQLDAFLAFLRASPNDLETPAIALVPSIGLVLAGIAQTPDVLIARMSGSGATCFGLYPDLATAQRAAEIIKHTLASAPTWVEADVIN